MFAAALVTDARAKARLIETLRGHLELRLCDSCGQLRKLALSAGASIVIVQPTDRHANVTWPVIADIRKAFPRLPILAYCSLRSSLSGDIVDLVRAGVHDIAVLEVDDSTSSLRAKMAKARTVGTADWAFIEIATHANTYMRKLLKVCLASSSRALSVSELAAVLAVNRKTLANWCRDAAAPPPGNIVSWCRLLMVAQLLEDSGRSIESVALELDFPTAGALRAMLRRYTSLNPQELRDAGGTQYMLDAFIHELSFRTHGRDDPRVAVVNRTLASVLYAVLSGMAV